uniref:Uncharacterized protein n=1 Tax=Haemonchus contortus TaxID=6289 RepID=A0A7I4Z1B4_HAECO|nr:hypothetical protein HCOI_00940500 [Haemonchus contortus]
MKNTTGSSNIFTIGRRAESLKDVKKRLSSKTLELIRQRGVVRATVNHQQTSELAKLCREAIKEDLEERRAAFMDEAAEAGKSIRRARRSFASHKTKMISLRRRDGTVTASRRAMEKVIYDFYSECLAPRPSSECDSLDYSGSRQG